MGEGKARLEARKMAQCLSKNCMQKSQLQRYQKACYKKARSDEAQRRIVAIADAPLYPVDMRSISAKKKKGIKTWKRVAREMSDKVCGQI